MRDSKKGENCNGRSAPRHARDGGGTFGMPALLRALLEAVLNEVMDE